MRDERDRARAEVAAASASSKTVLLLGAEGTGVPAPLLGEVDACLEIPQVGLLRSLNVHVSASLVMWEYCRQHPI